MKMKGVLGRSGITESAVVLLSAKVGVTEGELGPFPFNPATPLTLWPPGATTNPTYISRKNPSPLECFRAFLPHEALEHIAQAVTNSLQHRPVGPSEKMKRHYRPVSIRDIWTWIAQRLSLSLEKRRTLRDHFNSVRP